jgi:tRNA (cmo5U34)-methyltransferase
MCCANWWQPLEEVSVKSTVEQIRERFNNEVERFSNLETGQSATIDAPLVLDLISTTAAQLRPQTSAILDIGCGAGNYTLKLLEQLKAVGNSMAVDCTLVDLSQPMLERARSRVSQATAGNIELKQGDIRELTLADDCFDVVVAAAVLHHLRDEAEWRAVFAKIFHALKPGGSFWISDLIEHSTTAVQTLMWKRYGDYLKGFKGPEYRDQVYAYIEQEDTPRPLMFQIDLLRSVGFGEVEILHKNSCFAAFGAIKPRT